MRPGWLLSNQFCRSKSAKYFYGEIQTYESEVPWDTCSNPDPSYTKNTVSGSKAETLYCNDIICWDKVLRPISAPCGTSYETCVPDRYWDVGKPLMRWCTAFTARWMNMTAHSFFCLWWYQLNSLHSQNWYLCMLDWLGKFPCPLSTHLWPYEKPM